MPPGGLWRAPWQAGRYPAAAQVGCACGLLSWVMAALGELPAPRLGRGLIQNVAVLIPFEQIESSQADLEWPYSGQKSPNVGAYISSESVLDRDMWGVFETTNSSMEIWNVLHAPIGNLLGQRLR